MILVVCQAKSMAYRPPNNVETLRFRGNPGWGRLRGGEGLSSLENGSAGIRSPWAGVVLPGRIPSLWTVAADPETPPSGVPPETGRLYILGGIGVWKKGRRTGS